MRRRGVVALLVASSLSAQTPVSAPQPTAPGSDLTVYLMTMGTGDQVWERFGHNAIRIVDASRGTDSVYNWGTFDFHQPNFLRRFHYHRPFFVFAEDGHNDHLKGCEARRQH